MTNSDYILRMIEQFALFIGRVVFHRDAGQYEEAQRQLDLIVKDLLGLDPESLRGSARTRLRALLQEESDPERLAVIGRVLAEKSRIDAARGADVEEVTQSEEFAVRFLLKARERGAPTSPIERELATLAGRLGDGALASVGGALALHYENLGRFAKAEDLVFDLAKIDADKALALGLAFYDRLRGKSDLELERGALPRAELAEGERELRALAGPK